MYNASGNIETSQQNKLALKRISAKTGIHPGKDIAEVGPVKLFI